MLKLIGALPSPFVRKVRIVLAEKKIDYDFITEDVWSKDTTIQSYNPLGKVPALVIDDDPALFDSRVIVEYLDASSPVHRLIPPNGRERVSVRRWEALADGLMDAAVLIRIERTQRPPELQSEAWVARQMAKIDASLAEMERCLGDDPWCEGVQMSLADIAVGCAVFYLDFRFADKDWRSGHPNLKRLSDKLALRQSFVDTRPL